MTSFYGVCTCLECKGAMLDWYVGECMVSRININNGMQESTDEYRIVILVKC
jgi:hypothetical protein